MAVALLGVACGDSGGGSASDSNSNSNSGTGGATDGSSGSSEPTSAGSQSGTTGGEGGNSESMSGTTGAEGGNSESMSGSVSSGVESDSVSGSGTSGATTGMVTGGGESSTGVGETSTGEPIDCRTLESQADCVAAGCMPIFGSKFVSDDAAFCIDPPSYLACEEQLVCAEVITTVCKGQVKYQLANTCIPEGYTECPAPPDPGMDGFKECQ